LVIVKCAIPFEPVVAKSLLEEGPDSVSEILMPESRLPEDDAVMLRFPPVQSNDLASVADELVEPPPVLGEGAGEGAAVTVRMLDCVAAAV
jgi:hypothetical protein